MNIIDGNALAQELQAGVEDELKILRRSAVRPGLATVMIGADYGAES
jgi:5,10-methylene-tetrahydrofolate dehydrogenase/methenyl tetrahydrofolate cyclohydrolase